MHARSNRLWLGAALLTLGGIALAPGEVVAVRPFYSKATETNDHLLEKDYLWPIAQRWDFKDQSVSRYGIFFSYNHDTLATIRSVHEATGMQIDPHTAVGVKAARENMRDGVPMVTMATAHPAKFPDAVERATGVRPQLPEHLADLLTRPERTTTLPNDLAAVQKFVASVAR